MASFPFRLFLCVVVFLFAENPTDRRPCAAAASSQGKQRSLATVQFTFSVVDDHSELLIRANKPLEQYEAVTLDSPPRLVLDIADADFPEGASKIAVNRKELQKIRIGEHDRKVRFVFDLSLKHPVEHRVEQVPEGLKVIVKPAEHSPKEAVTKPEQKTITTDAPSSDAQPDPQGIVVLERTYTGKKISLEFNKANLRDFFALISEASGTRIEVAPDVNAEISMRIRDIPWDEAMDLILNYYSLKLEEQNGILRVLSGGRPAVLSADP